MDSIYIYVCVMLQPKKGKEIMGSFSKLSFQVGRLHCLLPWWEEATVDFMISGGYNVVSQIGHVW